MKTKLLIVVSGMSLTLLCGWFIIGLLLAGGIHRYLYGYEIETVRFTDYISIVSIGVLIVSLSIGVLIGYVAGSKKR